MIILLLSQTIACSGKLPAYSSHLSFSAMQKETDAPESTYDKHDREFKIKDFDKETFTDKTGYIILGLAGAAVTAAAIVIPFVILK